MFATSYDTTIIKNCIMQKTMDELERQRVIGNVQITTPKSPSGNPVGSDGFLMVTPGLAPIPPFGHPLVITDERHKMKTVYIDVRSATRELRDGGYAIQGYLEYNLAVLRGALQTHWLDSQDYIDLMNVGVVPIAFYARFLSDALTIRLALTTDIQMRVSVMSAYFYLCMFLENDAPSELDEPTKARFANMIARATYVSMPDVFKIIDELDRMYSIDDLVSALVTKGNSIRFEKLTRAFIYSIIGGGWWGANHNEIMSVALEHPPTWIALCFTSLQERGFRKTGIGRIAEQHKNSDDVASFVKAVEYLIKYR